MSQNSMKPSNYEDQFDLADLLQLLAKQKKILISSILIFTTLAVLYSIWLKPTFKSSTIIEIGYFEMSDGTKKMLESSANLIADLKVDLIYKKLSEDHLLKLFISPFEDLEYKIIKFEYTSESISENEKFLNEILNYVDERHTRLAKLIKEQKVDEISFELFLNNNIKTFIENIHISNDLVANNLFDFQRDSFKKQLIYENQLQNIEAQKIFKTRPIAAINTITIHPRYTIIILLGLVIGFLSGTLFIIFNRFRKIL